MKTLYKASVILLIFLAIVILTTGTSAALMDMSDTIILDGLDPTIVPDMFLDKFIWP